MKSKTQIKHNLSVDTAACPTPAKPSGMKPAPGDSGMTWLQTHITLSL